eukprot:Pompholyxophrys_punicea_v1_NODE_222_length_2701_cov_12.239229.p5 type:complete len:104 gc:universal NODE_222_length_2701_cov_12.239229:1229-918(-)
MTTKTWDSIGKYDKLACSELKDRGIGRAFEADFQCLAVANQEELFQGAREHGSPTSDCDEAILEEEVEELTDTDVTHLINNFMSFEHRINGAWEWNQKVKFEL